MQFICLVVSEKYVLSEASDICVNIFSILEGLLAMPHGYSEGKKKKERIWLLQMCVKA